MCGTVNAVEQCRVAAWSQQFVQMVSQLMGLPKNRMWVYTGAWFWNPQAGGSSLLKSYPLWVSGYVQGSPPVPKVCTPTMCFGDKWWQLRFEVMPSRVDTHMMNILLPPFCASRAGRPGQCGSTPTRERSLGSLGASHLASFLRIVSPLAIALKIGTGVVHSGVDTSRFKGTQRQLEALVGL